jgi:hypothetical protein
VTSERSTTRSDRTRRSPWRHRSSATNRPRPPTFPTPNLSQILDTGHAFETDYYHQTVPADQTRTQ